MSEINRRADESGMIVIAMERLARTFSGRKTGYIQALEDITLDIREGEFFSIVGPSGCGKTTLLKILSGILQPSAGKVSIAGGSPQTLSKEGRIGMVFQRPALMPWRTVEGNIRLPLEMKGKALACGEEVEELLSLVGMERFRHSYPKELSGGMRQRVAIARALAGSPDILLMDEPFSSLDEISRDGLNLELLRIYERLKPTVVYVTHSIAEAVFLSDRVAVLSGSPTRVKKVYDIDLPRPRQGSARYSSRLAEQSRVIHETLAGSQAGNLKDF